MMVDRVTDPKAMMEGATYALVYFFDANGDPVDRTEAVSVNVEFYDSADRMIGHQTGQGARA